MFGTVGVYRMDLIFLELEKPRRRPAEHEGSLRQIGREALNSIVLRNRGYIYRKIIS